MTTTDYAEFLAGKHKSAADNGPMVEPNDIHPNLFPFQRDLTAWAVRKGRAALFADTGLGKTRMQVEWASHVAPFGTLIIAPLSVARQTVREAEKIDQSVTYVRSPDQVNAPGIYITNYEMAPHFAPDDFGAVVLDECFPAGTLVDTPNGSKDIKDFRIGDQVNSAKGTDVVWDVHRREVRYAVVISFAGQRVTCSPNHPWLTQRGWVGAQDIEPGDSLVPTTQAVRMVRAALREEDKGVTRTSSILRHVLLSEMADERPGACGETTHAGDSSQAWRGPQRMAGVGASAGRGGTGSHTSDEPHEQAGSASEGLPPIEIDGPRTFRAWREWHGADATSVDDDGCTGRALEGGVLCVIGPTDSRLSDALQARLGERRAASRYRTGWQLAPQPEVSGLEEGQEARLTRVDGIEVLEPGDPRLDRLRDAEGSLYFYDLGVVGHPSFSIAGQLVHNSSILKNHTGATRNQLVNQWAGVPFRLACTATPAPNDVTEMANHVEFLGIMSRTEFLASYFVHDDDGWRPKGHAIAAMFSWMSTWATAVRRPSDLGYPDAGYDLPPMTVTPEVVDVDIESDGQLFATDLGGVGGRHAVRRSTLAARVARSVELVDGRDQWIVWCGLNPEANQVAAAVDGAENVEGSMSPERKAELLEAFQDGEIRVLVSKPSICGLGMNFQNAHRMVFVGVNDSWESYYQAIRRCWRFGQTEPVDVRIVVSELEQQIVANLARKEREAATLVSHLVAEMRRARSDGGV